MQLLPASGHRIQRWKNGGGATTEIAVHPGGAGLDEFEWRVSMAAMTVDGPFSVFPGVARILAVLDGPGVVLSAGSFGEKTLTRETPPFAFDGGEPVACRLIDGRTTDLNLMFREDRYRCAMQRLPISGTLRLPPAPGTRFVVLIDGKIAVSGSSSTLNLMPFDALRDTGGATLEINAAEPSLAFVLTIAALK